MGISELFILSFGLAMDAFAVAVCKGLSLEKLTARAYIIVGLWFGGFQAAMPVLGWALGSAFSESIEKFDHWIAFVLLALIGLNMIREAFSKATEKKSASLGFRTMLVMAVATSIDALAVGVSFAFLRVNIILAATLIGATTFILSCVGVKVGNAFGLKYKSKAELAGGVILICLGAKILVEHLS